MDTFHLSVYNFINQIHYKKSLKCSQPIESGHVLQFIPKNKHFYHFVVSVRGSTESFGNIEDTLFYANRYREDDEITIFVCNHDTTFGCSTITQQDKPKLTVVINREIQIIVDIGKLPLTFETLIDLIDKKMKKNLLQSHWQNLDFDKEADMCPTNGFISRMKSINSNLQKFGKTKVFLKSVEKEEFDNFITSYKVKETWGEEKIISQKPFDKEKVSNQETLNKIIEGINKLELSIEKSFKDDIFVNIPLQDEELFQFYDKIKNEGQLKDLKHSYEKYQQWLTLYGNDENKVETHLIKQNDLANEIINNSVKSNLTAPQIATNPIQHDLLDLKIFYLDLNVCFKFTNNQTNALPSGLTFEFDYTVPIGMSSKRLTYSVDLIHGISANTTKTYTRFKHELGNNFRIQNLGHVRIIKKNGDEVKVLYSGVRDYFKEDKEDKPVRIFNWETAEPGTNVESLSGNDIISTDIESATTSSALDIDEYDLLTESDSTTI